MSTLIIPCDPVLPFWTQTTTLDGVPYLLTFTYNQRETVYYLSISSADATVDYVLGMKLVPGIPLLRPWPTPPGEMFVITQSADDSPPALGELADGARCVLMYVEAATLFQTGNTVDPERFPGFVV
jgi:uncharacterized protein DUF6983